MHIIMRLTEHFGPGAAALLAVALMVSATSCSVKEDRDLCPAYLTVRSNGHIGEPSYSENIFYNISATAGGSHDEATGTFTEFSDEGRIFKSPRKKSMTVSVAGGVKNMIVTDSLVRIPVGMECDRILGGSGTVWVPEDLGEITLPLQRNYCNIQMGIVGTVYDPYPYYFLLKGNVDGFELPSFNPHVGRFEKRIDIAPGDIFECRVPRQFDDGLVVEARSVTTNEVVTEIPVGQLAREMDYDWRKADLDDILINIDFARTMVSITVADWTVEIVVKLLI